MRVIVWKMVDEYSETETPESTQSSQTLELAACSTRQKSIVWKYFGIEKNSSGAAQRDRRVTYKLCAESRSRQWYYKLKKSLKDEPSS